jgi:hypothetical protein
MNHHSEAFEKFCAATGLRSFPNLEKAFLAAISDGNVSEIRVRKYENNLGDNISHA